MGAGQGRAGGPVAGSPTTLHSERGGKRGEPAQRRADRQALAECGRGARERRAHRPQGDWRESYLFKRPAQNPESRRKRTPALPPSGHQPVTNAKSLGRSLPTSRPSLLATFVDCPSRASRLAKELRRADPMNPGHHLILEFWGERPPKLHTHKR